MLWTSCGLIVDFLPYYIRTKKETKKNSLKGSLKKTSVMFCQRSGRFFKLCWKLLPTMLEVPGSFQHSLGMICLLFRNGYFQE